MPCRKIVLSPTRFSNVNGVARFAHNLDVLMGLLPDEGVPDDVRTISVRAAVRGKDVEVSVSGDANFAVADDVNCIAWYITPGELYLLRRALSEARAAADFFGSPS